MKTIPFQAFRLWFPTSKNKWCSSNNKLSTIVTTKCSNIRPKQKQRELNLQFKISHWTLANKMNLFHKEVCLISHLYKCSSMKAQTSLKIQKLISTASLDKTTNWLGVTISAKVLYCQKKYRQVEIYLLSKLDIASLWILFIWRILSEGLVTTINQQLQLITIFKRV